MSPAAGFARIGRPGSAPKPSGPSPANHHRKGLLAVKKLLVLVLVLAVGALVVKKVREA